MSPNIIIRTPNHLGDCIMALPMINEAGEAHPGATITVLVPENLAEIFYPSPVIDNIIRIPQKHVHGLIAVTKIKDMIAPLQFDIGYILPPSFGSAAAFKLAGIKERIGYIADGRRLLLTKPLPLTAPLNALHRSEHYFNLLRRGSGHDIEYVRPKLFLNDDDLSRLEELLSGFDITKQDDFIAIAFQAVAESRRWGEEKYTALVKKIVTDLGLTVMLIGGEQDQALGDRIAEVCGTSRVKNIAGKTSIRETASVLSVAKGFVGNDSGPAHLAAAVGCPIVVLSGADDPKETSPMASDKKLIYLENLECISCVKNRCPLKGDQYMQCLNGISVDLVYAQLCDLIA